MEAVRERSQPLFLQFVHLARVSEDEAVDFHNDLLNIYVNNHIHDDYQLIRDSAKACMKIGHLMALSENTWFRSRSILYWTLYIFNMGVISIELADDMILAAFRTEFASI